MCGRLLLFCLPNAARDWPPSLQTEGGQFAAISIARHGPFGGAELRAPLDCSETLLGAARCSIGPLVQVDEWPKWTSGHSWAAPRCS